MEGSSHAEDHIGHIGTIGDIDIRWSALCGLVHFHDLALCQYAERSAGLDIHGQRQTICRDRRHAADAGLWIVENTSQTTVEVEMLDTVILHEVYTDLIHHEMVLTVLDAVNVSRQDERVAIVIEIL